MRRGERTEATPRLPPRLPETVRDCPRCRRRHLGDATRCDESLYSDALRRHRNHNRKTQVPSDSRTTPRTLPLLAHLSTSFPSSPTLAVSMEGRATLEPDSFPPQAAPAARNKGIRQNTLSTSGGSSSMADLAEYPEGSGEYYVDVRGDRVRVRGREEGEEEFGAWSGAGRGPTGEENGGQCRHRSDSTFNSSNKDSGTLCSGSVS